jgi:5-formyltetrahydrofolate cyclo-ligase
MSDEKLLYLFNKARNLLKSNGKYQLFNHQVVDNIENAVFFNKNNTISVFFGDKYLSLQDILFNSENYDKNIFVYPRLINGKVKYFHIESPNSLVVQDNNIVIPSEDCFMVDNNMVDIILVPGDAFDNYHSRLDSDPHLYDKAILEANATAIGVCLDSQVYRGKLPVSGAKVNGLLTEEGLYYIVNIEE